jgi:hypothetical protein
LLAIITLNALEAVIEVTGYGAMAVLFLEINEATSYFVEKFIAAGKLPNFARILADGATIRSHIPDVSSDDPRFTRKTSPWIVWSSVYTGMRPGTHELIGFGQDTRHLMGRYLWDALAQAGRSYGIFGSLISFPPRPEARFYVPDSLSTTSDCVPETLRPLQNFFLFGAHHYSQTAWTAFARAGLDLLRATGTALSMNAAARALSQIPLELIGGGPAKADRAMLYSILVADAFDRIYRKTRPDFATAHFNHIAYFQHRYWRASEPERFSHELSSTDRRFYGTVTERESDEARYADKIERAYVWTDRLVGRAMDMLSDEDVLVIGSALGQRPYDPISEIHNPVIRFENADRFFEHLGFTDFRVQYEMNPDLTLDCASSEEATRYSAMINGLEWPDGSAVFFCQQRRRQLFLELVLPPAVEHDRDAVIRHRERAGFVERAQDYVWQSGTNEQSTAHHAEEGLFMVWRKGRKIQARRQDILITEIAPAFLELYRLDPCEWHRDYAGPLFT